MARPVQTAGLAGGFLDCGHKPHGFIFDYTVIATGAWARHPVEYVVLNAVTIPLVPCCARSRRAGGGRRWGAR